MISLYSGTPGSGKSLHLADRLYWRVKTNKPTICNFPIALSKITKKKRDCFHYVYDTKLTPKYLKDFAAQYWKNNGGKVKEDTILLVIDECQRMFNSRDWGNKDRKEWLEFFSLHRHLGYEIILCCQFDRMLDRQIRCLIEYEHTHRKMKNFGWKGWLVNLLAGGGLFICVQRWYPIKEKVSVEFFRAKKKYFSIYDTFLSFDSEQPQSDPQGGVANAGALPEDQTEADSLENYNGLLFIKKLNEAQEYFFRKYINKL